MESSINKFSRCPQSLINKFLSGTLSFNIKTSLTKHFNNYYKTALSIEQLKDVFSNAITAAMDRIEILAPIFAKIDKDR